MYNNIHLVLLTHIQTFATSEIFRLQSILMSLKYKYTAQQVLGNRFFFVCDIPRKCGFHMA